MPHIKLIHYREDCIGCNACIESSPANWKINERDGKADLVGGKETKKGVFLKEIFPIELEENKRAERDCPARIIKVDEN